MRKGRFIEYSLNYSVYKVLKDIHTSASEAGRVFLTNSGCIDSVKDLNYWTDKGSQ